MNEGVIKSIKAFDCRATVYKYIDVVEKGKLPPIFIILDAMTILTNAWNKVTAETVRNYFKKAGSGYEAQRSAVCDADDLLSYLRVLERKLLGACASLCDS